MHLPKSPRRVGFGIAAAIGLVFSACADAGTPVDVVRQLDHIPGEPPELHTVFLCKFGTNASFNVDTTFVDRSTGTPLGPTASFNVSLTAGECSKIVRSPDHAMKVVITELADPNIVLDSITTQEVLLVGGAQPTQKVTGTSSVTVTIHGDLGYIVRYYNSPKPPQLEGCTPGFWKNHTDLWPAPYTPGTLIKNVFSGATGSLGDTSLLAGLSFGGGPGVAGASQNLLRAAIAAVLNAAASLNYGQSVTDIVNAVNAALASGDRSTINSLASSLDAANNAGCTLDTTD